ncbi:MAG: hypothetical protein PHW82_14635 [Bacteroidales bacterium]|nr:hypothetical protein [Bacteroidales bacterium]
MKKIFLKLASLPLASKIFASYVNYIAREKKKSYGVDNPDLFFYVIGQKERTGGLWWIVNKVVMHLAYAEDKGYIPVVDYKHFWTQYHMDEELGNVNVWEKFFLQPSSYNLDDISRSRNIIIADKHAAPSDKYFMGNTDFYDDPSRLVYFQNIFKKYIKFSVPTKAFLEEKRNSIIPTGTRVVGVLSRGTDYILKKPKNHPIQPEPQDIVEHTDEILKKYNCKYVFIATEDADIFELFKDRFGDSLLFVNQKRISKKDIENEELLVDVTKKSNQDKYIMGLNYLLATYILSTCTCFIAGRTGGTKGVLLMQDNFEYKYVYNLGLYK